MLVTEGQDATQGMSIHVACNVIRVWHHSNVWSKLWQGNMSDSAALLQPRSVVTRFLLPLKAIQLPEVCATTLGHAEVQEHRKSILF